MHKSNVKSNVKPNAKSNSDSEFIETKFESRAISKMNKSRVIALPKVALSNLCGTHDPERMDVTLVQNDKVKFIKLTPTQCNGKEKTK